MFSLASTRQAGDPSSTFICGPQGIKHNTNQTSGRFKQRSCFQMYLTLFQILRGHKFETSFIEM